ncbi:MAG: hypothetical protein M3509_00175 [Chloroflexota bacterium]|nr:hypothetical protein [Chloroflexota bacterium]
MVRTLRDEHVRNALQVSVQAEGCLTPCIALAMELLKPRPEAVVEIKQSAGFVNQERRGDRPKVHNFLEPIEIEVAAQPSNLRFFASNLSHQEARGMSALVELVDLAFDRRNIRLVSRMPGSLLDAIEHALIARFVEMLLTRSAHPMCGDRRLQSQVHDLEPRLEHVPQ